MSTCVFKTSDVLRCVEHALKAPKWSMAYEEGSIPPAPALLFVHDQGVYLMSNGIPLDQTDPANPESHSYVAYAEGCNPNIGDFDDWYGTSRDLVGGNDFAEVIAIVSDWPSLCAEFNELHIEVTENTLEAIFTKPKKRKKVKA